MTSLDDLKAFIEKGNLLGAKKGYHPTEFMKMHKRYGPVEAIKRLVIAGDIQTGFRRLEQLGLLEWSLEAAVLKFPDLFGPKYREAAEFRLAQLQPKNA